MIMKKTLRTIASVLSGTLLVSLLVAGCGAQNTGNQETNQSVANSTSTAANNGSSTADNTTNNGTAKMTWTSPPKMQIDKNKQYGAVFHTNYGDFTVQLFANESPMTVNNFVFLVNHHFYKNDSFFRIIKTFMIQTGDPQNNGTGGPGYEFQDELPTKHSYEPGIVAMANAGPNTNGSQFFICTGQDSTQLNKTPNYTEFGKVVKGMDVVQKIAAIPVTTNPQTGEPSMPLKKAYIQSIDITVK
jgi:cyclophilin family peptidyl-prolyl cis-trans isomerase